MALLPHRVMLILLLSSGNPLPVIVASYPPLFPLLAEVIEVVMRLT